MKMLGGRCKNKGALKSSEQNAVHPLFAACSYHLNHSYVLPTLSCLNSMHDCFSGTCQPLLASMFSSYATSRREIFCNNSCVWRRAACVVVTCRGDHDVVDTAKASNKHAHTHISTSSTAQRGGGSFRIGNLQGSLDVENRGWQSESTEGLKGGWSCFF